jgi:small GTP-binding protein
MSEEEDLKVILLGESGVGKTNLINITMGEELNEEVVTTSNSSYSVKKINLNGKDYDVKLWDTIGQEKLRHLTKLFYSDSKIVIFVYDISERPTFEALNDYWVKDVNEKLGQNIIKGLVANKIDKFMEEKVTQEEGEEYAKNIGARFIVTSAKTEGPKKFEELIMQLLEDYLKKIGKIAPDNNVGNSNIKIGPEKPKKKKKIC